MSYGCGSQPLDAAVSDGRGRGDRLKKTGVEIARRTVAKYREGMNIPSSFPRRREKRALAWAKGL